MKNDKQIPYCLDSGITKGTDISISLCYPSQHVNVNRDPDQHWIVRTDATIVSKQNESLCVTNLDPNIEGGGNQLMLDVCDGRVEQHYSYHTTPRDGIVPGEFYYGDDTNIIGVV